MEQTATEQFSFAVAGRSRVEVRVEEGSIEVAGSRTGEVTVNAVKRARASTAERAAALIRQIFVEAHQDEGTGTVRVESRRGTRWGIEDLARGRILRSDLRIAVPSESDLDLVTGDGDVEIEGIRGLVEAETGDGHVRLRDVEGKVKTRSSDGSIVGSRVEGVFDASTRDGGIELDGRFGGVRAVTGDGPIHVRCDADSPSPSEDWILRTSAGSIVLVLPGGLSADLDVSAGEGRISSDLRLATAERGDGQLRGRIGEGGKLILIRTDDGRVTLRSRSDR